MAEKPGKGHTSGAGARVGIVRGNSTGRMIGVTWLVLGLCFIATVTLHELGHAVYMRRNGVSLKEICILGIGPILAEFRVPYFGETPVRIRAIPVGAFVLPDKAGLESLKGLSFLARGEIFGAGIVANVAFAAALFGFGMLVCAANHLEGVVAFGVSLIVAWGLMISVRWISIGLPVLGIGLLAYMVHDIAVTGIAKLSGAIGGPVMMSKFFSVQVHAHPWSLQEGIVLGTVLSLALGMGNLFPFLPFDGGHLSKNLIRRLIGEVRYPRVERATNYALLVPGSLLIAVAIASDLSHLI